MKKVFIILGALFILMGTTLFSYSLYTDFKYIEEDTIKTNMFFEDFNNKVDSHEKEEKKETIISNYSNNNINYLGVIEIPNIGLKSGFVLSDSTFSTMNRNVSVYPTSKMPSEKGNFILFAHSGNSRVGYFKNIYKLKENNLIYIYYNSKKYTYKIKEVLELSKSNHLPLSQETNMSRITLITCKKDDSNKRIIILGELENVG